MSDRPLKPEKPSRLALLLNAAEMFPDCYEVAEVGDSLERWNSTVEFRDPDTTEEREMRVPFKTAGVSITTLVDGKHVGEPIELLKEAEDEGKPVPFPDPPTEYESRAEWQRRQKDETGG